MKAYILCGISILYKNGKGHDWEDRTRHYQCGIFALALLVNFYDDMESKCFLTSISMNNFYMSNS